MDGIIINGATLATVLISYAHLWYKIGKLEGEVKILCRELNGSSRNSRK